MLNSPQQQQLRQVVIKAGKVSWDGKTCVPDKRKGLISLDPGNDGLMHFRWSTRGLNAIVEDDLIVVENAYLEKVDAVKDSRIVVLKFTTYDKKLMFWLQEPEESKDEELIRQFNELAGASNTAKPQNDELMSIMRNHVVNPTSSNTQQRLNPLTDLLTNLRACQRGQVRPRPQVSPTSLEHVLTTEALNPLLSDEEAVKELLQHLPEGHKCHPMSSDDIRQITESSCLATSLRNLTQAIYSDELPALLTSLGLDPSLARADVDALDVFIDALTSKYGNKEHQGSESNSSSS